MKANSHELCRKILSNIYDLRGNLKKLEEAEPTFDFIITLFEEDGQPVNSHGECWTTDEILERMAEEISSELKESENLATKEEVERFLKRSGGQVRSDNVT